jgi:hypothetical protein
MASKSDIRNLEYTLIAIALFSLFVAHNADPSGFGPFLVWAIAYFSSLALLVAGSGFARKGRLTYLLMVILGTAAVLLLVYAATAGNGLPAQGNQISYSCHDVQIPNATSPTGFTDGGSSCTSSPYYVSSSVLYNAAFWLPLVGSIVYAMPSWIDPGKRNPVTSFSRNLRGSVPAGTLLLLTFGLDNQSSGYPELFSGHSPLNPFVAYNYCDSTIFGVISCVQVNVLSYFADYAFWIAVTALLALVLSELFQSMKAVLRHGGGGRLPTVEEGSAPRPVESSSTEMRGEG